MERFKQKFRSETGATMVETGVMLALLVLIAAVGVTNFGDAIGEYYCDLYDNTSDASGSERKGLGWGLGGHEWNSDTNECEPIGAGCPPGFICNGG